LGRRGFICQGRVGKAGLIAKELSEPKELPEAVKMPDAPPPEALPVLVCSGEEGEGCLSAEEVNEGDDTEMEEEEEEEGAGGEALAKV